MASSQPKFLYHISNLVNFHSIMIHGLGAKKGKGIDLHLAKKGVVYLIDFDPIPFLTCSEFSQVDINTQNQLSILLRICSLIHFESVYCKFAIFKIDAKNLESIFLKKDLEEFVFIYSGVIYEFEVFIYEMIDTKNIQFKISGHDVKHGTYCFHRLITSSENKYLG